MINKEKWLTVDGVHMSPFGDALMAIGVLRAMGIPDEKIAIGANHSTQGSGEVARSSASK
ncbi:MAG: hypothetical protein ACHRXM_30465 [Isosphaerales bacterium]